MHTDKHGFPEEKAFAFMVQMACGANSIVSVSIRVQRWLDCRILTRDSLRPLLRLQSLFVTGPGQTAAPSGMSLPPDLSALSSAMIPRQ